jgi:glycosyltransferase involved in cell wall biosynthesis
MVIGINASSALKENPTGVEEYTFQLIKHLAVIPGSKGHRFILYLNSRLKSERIKEFKSLPKNFRTEFLSFPFCWTQIRLAAEMMSAAVDVLFIPVHILPFVRPKKTVVSLHGLEYEHFPEAYPYFHRRYLRWSTKYALENASKIIAVSESTKQDLIKLYGGNPNKITVVHHGVSQPQTEDGRSRMEKNSERDNPILSVGRVESKKNILGIIEAYGALRRKNPFILNKLVLAGGSGFGFGEIRAAIENSRFKKDIVLKGYVSESEKNDLLENSAVFVFPSFYEGFGMPVLEAQNAGVPVIASNSSCLPEIAGSGAVLINPNNPWEIALAMRKILGDESLRQKLIQAGLENVKRFSWKKCARETLRVLETAG